VSQRAPDAKIRRGSDLAKKGIMAERGSKILVVDADSNRRTMVELAFSYNGHGFLVFTAPNGRSAMLQLGIVRPDLILLDVTMPDGDGLETLRRIREVSTVPVIALTSAPDDQVAVQSLEQGADCCLAQPWDVKELRARALALLRRSEGANRQVSRSNRDPFGRPALAYRFASPLVAT
jgi:two-component system KDP operon response regulator KdpE